MGKSLEIFVLTNGSSTLQATMDSLEKQSVERHITIIQDLPFLKSMKTIMEECRSQFFMKVDDDMWLHPFAVEYYESLLNRKIRGPKDLSLVWCSLYQPWSVKNKIIDSLKIYNHSVANKLGFKPDKYGRIDHIYLDRIRKGNRPVISDRKSVVGMHLLRTEEEQIHYQKIWLSQMGAKSIKRKLVPAEMSVKEQVLKGKELRRINNRRMSGFFRFIRSHRTDRP